MSTSRSSIIFQTRPESYDRRAGAAGSAVRGPCKRIGRRAHSKGSLARARSDSSCCSSARARSCGSSKTSFSTVSSELGSVVRAVSASVERPEGGVRTVLVGLPQYSDLIQRGQDMYNQQVSQDRKERRGGGGDYGAGRTPPKLRSVSRISKWASSTIEKTGKAGQLLRWPHSSVI